MKPIRQPVIAYALETPFTLIASVLMQSGKGSGLSDAFGGGGGGAFFGKGNDVDTLMAKVTIPNRWLPAGKPRSA